MVRLRWLASVLALVVLCGVLPVVALGSPESKALVREGFGSVPRGKFPAQKGMTARSSR
jgi:hypothetical protein